MFQYCALSSYAFTRALLNKAGAYVNRKRKRKGVNPRAIRTILVDSAKQAHYVRDMIQCPTLFTTSERAVESAVTGRFQPRLRPNA